MLGTRGNQPFPAQKKFPVLLNSHERNHHLFPKALNGAEIIFLRFFSKQHKKKRTQKQSGPERLYRRLPKCIKEPIYKNQLLHWLMKNLFAFWTRGASLSISRTQREMHVAGSMCTVKTFPFWADVPDTLEILLPDMLGD